MLPGLVEKGMHFEIAKFNVGLISDIYKSCGLSKSLKFTWYQPNTT